MKRKSSLFPVAIIAAVLYGANGAAIADDTEIFESEPIGGAAARPNIMLIIDTSGSMVDNNVTQAMDYDPLIAYRTANSCNGNRIYWKLASQSAAVSCGNNYIDAATLVCKAAKDRVDTLGYHTIASTAQWSGSGRQWGALSTAWHSTSYPVECAEDRAIGHGRADGDNLLPSVSNGPFTSNPAQATDLIGNTYVFYSGNYLNYLANAGSDSLVTLTRLEVVKSVARRFLDSLSNVNVGLMRFQNKDSSRGAADGGYVIHEFAPIETARDALKSQITGLNGNSYTPLSETLYEAYLYWKGGTPRYGNTTTSTAYSYSIDAARVSAGGNYKSPLTNACATNFNVLLTDGDPTGDKDADSSITGLTGMVGTTIGTTVGTANVCSNNGGSGTSVAGQSAGDGKCLDDIAKYMFDNDLYDDPDVEADSDPKNNVRTYVIGFGTGISDASIMGSTAKAGNGKAYVATDTITLTEAFQDIARDVIEDNVSFSAPVVAVNSFNRTQNLNDLFITVFAPSEQYHWAGNVKKYFLDHEGTIRDSRMDAAVDDGFFAAGTRSFWSEEDDGPTVTLGGSAHKLPDPADRNVYTDVVPSSALSAAANHVVSTNADQFEASDLGLPDAATEEQIEDHIDWIRGADVDDGDEDGVTDEGRFVMGDPLHARPAVVIYRGTESDPEPVIYAATNDGYLHAIDPDDGSELWAYIPSELLPRTVRLREDAVSSAKQYGLDGSIRAHKIDRDNDGIVEEDDGDRVLLFFGMGRGGSNYYALDVTDENNPELLWRHGTGDTFIGLGQTWSTPVVTRINVAGTTQNADKLVLVFGGGYDPTQDDISYNTDNTGNRLFIVDAISGNVLWHAGPTNVAGLGFDSTANFTHALMTNSFAADVRVIDITGDGFADRMYAADTGGRVWRFDIFNGNAAGTASSDGGSVENSLVTGGVFASLGIADGNGTAPGDSRKFYNAPDAALVGTGAGRYINIAIGSGHRGHPKDTQITDRIYGLRDYRPFALLTQEQYNDPDAFETILDSALTDVTTNVTATIPANGKGWKITLDAGEKSLSEARTFQGAVLMTTFNPNGRSSVVSSGCRSNSGINAFYALKVADGSPYTGTEPEDRRNFLEQGGLAPEPVIVFPPPQPPDPPCTGEDCPAPDPDPPPPPTPPPPPACLIGVEKCDISFGSGPVKTFWSQKEVD